MKGFFAIIAFASAAMGHNMVTHFHINGVPNASCVRPVASADPLIDVTSDTMACNIVTNKDVKTKCTVKYGDAIAFEWRVDRNIAPADYPLKDGTIPVGVTDDSHKGPCAVYMKKVNDATTAVGAGDGWFKVTDEGVVDGVFCTDRLRLANAPQPGTIPAGIAPGDYLMRAEFLTLNNAGPAGARQPQFYAGCVQVTVEGTTGTMTPDTVSIPGYVNMDTPGLIWDIWNSPNGRFSNYPMVGPAPVSANAAAGPAAPSPSPSPSSPPSHSLPGIPPLPTTAAGKSSTPVYKAPASSTSQAEASEAPEKPAGPTTAAPSAVPTGPSKVKIVTETTFITVTSTVLKAAPTDVPDDEEPEQDYSGDDSESNSDDPEPPHGHGNVHGYRHRRS